jgi:hypothetical protein
MKSIRALLSGIVDYAGLFPPAKLEMAPAVRDYAQYGEGGMAWMLGRFVLPAARLEEFEAAAGKLLPPPGRPAWPLSALAAGDLAETARLVEAFRARRAGSGAEITSLESRISDPAGIRDALAAAPEGVELFFELPAHDDPAPALEALAGTVARAKIRTGGVTGDAFPTADQLLRFILACTRAGVPFKATAGLHHPLRGEYRLTYEPDSPSGTMFGFLNVFLAAAFARAGRLDETALLRLLEESDPSSLEFDDEGAGWHGERLSLAELARSRGSLALSYGSCSFTEPVEELRALGLLS